MSRRHTTQQPLSPELEAIAAAAADRLRAQVADNPASMDEHARAVADAASAAIRAGAALSAIADAEQVGEDRARTELRSDILRKVERAARRKRETDADYESAIDRAARLGLSHRDIATAAAVSHGTVRAVLARADTHGDEAPPAAVSDDNGAVHQTDASEPLAA
jgi:DNA-binding NarL/FixJ family response regulator